MAKKKKTENADPKDPNTPPAPPRTVDQARLALRRKARAYYDIQEMRLQAQGRLLKKHPTMQIELHPDDLKKIQTRVDELEAIEKGALVDLEEELHAMPFYVACIEPKRKTQYKGLGPRMAGVILSSFDIHRADTVSKMWKFAGLAPIPCRRCRQCFTVVKPEGETDPETGEARMFQHPPNAAGLKCPHAKTGIALAMTVASGQKMSPKPGEKLAYNAWLRTKLVGVLGPVLMRLGSPYRKYYDDFKQRWQSAGKGRSDAHRHQAANRYMIKMLLLDIWREWRTFEGLEVRPTYQEEKLGHIHSGSTPATPAQPPAATLPTAEELRQLEVDDEVQAALRDAS